MRTNQIEEMRALNYTILSLANTQIESNKAFQRLNGVNHLMTLVTDLDNVVQNVESFYEAFYKTSSLPIMAIDLLSSTDISKIEEKFALPINRNTLPSLSLLENLKTALKTASSPKITVYI